MNAARNVPVGASYAATPIEATTMTARVILSMGAIIGGHAAHPVRAA